MATIVSPINRLCRGIDCFTEITGKAISWLTLALIVTTCAVVVLRYFLGTGSIALQESATYIHAALFMLAMGFTLKRGGHVRVDVLYRGMSPRRQAVVDVLGTALFLIPVSILIFSYSLDYVLRSWAMGETSTEGSGIPLVFVLKTLLLVLPVTLVLQGVSELLKNLLFALGLGGSHTAEKVELL